MTRAIIIEDEAPSLTLLQNQLKKYCPDVEVIATGASNADLIRIVEELDDQIDVAFLDIVLLDGVAFQGLEKLDDIPFDIIFTTAFNDYALKAFEFAALDYVLKPIAGEDLQRAVSRIRIRSTPPQTKERLGIMQTAHQGVHPNPFDKMGISAQDGIHFVRLSEIVRLEAADNYTHFILKNAERITASKTIKSYEAVLKDFNFVRVHKRHIVNMNYIKTQARGEGGYLILENGDKVDIARRKKNNLGKSLNEGYFEI